MTQRPYHTPSWSDTAFDCPHCGAYAQQKWARAVAVEVRADLTPANPAAAAVEVRAGRTPADEPHSFDSVRFVQGHWIAFCDRCDAPSVWLNDRMIHPEARGGPPPNPDLPEDIRRDYLEAQGIVGRSPRGAAALLRLCIQKLCKQLGEKGQNINDDVGSLVRKGLPTAVQQALDAVRVIGNEAVHPGQMDLKDDRQTAETLFQLVNLVVQRMISEPKAVQAIYDGLPETARDKIAKRDQARPIK